MRRLKRTRQKPAFSKIKSIVFSKPASILLTLGLIIMSVFFLKNSQMFLIKNIDCTLDNYPCPETLQPILTNLHHQNLINLSSSQLKNQLSAFDSLFQKIEIDKSLPSTLKITITRQYPIAKLFLVSSEEINSLTDLNSATQSAEIKTPQFSLAQNGKIFSSPYQTAENLPLVYTTNLDASEWLASLILSLKNHYVSYQFISYFNQDLTIVRLTPLSQAYFDPHKDLNKQVASLQYILRGSKIDEQIPSKIDLRFDKPVLTY